MITEEQFHVSCNLSNLTIQRRASLVTSTILKEVSLSVAACSDLFSPFDNLDLRKLIEDNYELELSRVREKIKTKFV